MGFVGRILKLIVKFLIYIAISASIIILIPNLPPYAKFSSQQLDPTQPRVGALAPNDALNNAKKLYLNKVQGPEAFQVYNGELYTGMYTGEVVKISPTGQLTFVTKIGRFCLGDWQEHICGRPLGFRIDEKSNQLYVVDAYYGIWKVDLKTDVKRLLVAPSVTIGNRPPKLMNSIALGKNGDFYWTDSSSYFPLNDGLYNMLADPSGRLFHYNAAQNRSVVLLDDLWFANGVAVSPDNQFVVVAETARCRLLRYYIDGPKKGKSDVFVQGLPGTPDNVQPLPDGSGVLVGLYTMFDDQHPLLLRSLGPVPVLRKLLSRLQKLVEIPFEYANQIYPHYFFEYMVYMIGNFRSVADFLPPLSGLVQIDWNGNIIASYVNTDSSLKTISDAVVFNEMLYTGSPHQPYIGAIPAPESLKRAFIPAKKTPPPKTAETVTEKIPDKKTVKPVEVKQVKEEAVKKVKENERKETPTTERPKATTQVPKVTTPKPTQAPPEQAKPKEAAKPKPQTETPKPVTEKPKPATEKPKPVTEKPKPVTEKPKPQVEKPVVKKTETPKAAEKQKPVENKAPKRPQKDIPDHIPVKEDITSDTAKPDKETIKVIKKEGPTEIPIRSEGVI